MYESAAAIVEDAASESGKMDRIQVFQPHIFQNVYSSHKLRLLIPLQITLLNSSLENNQ